MPRIGMRTRGLLAAHLCVGSFSFARTKHLVSYARMLRSPQPLLQTTLSKLIARKPYLLNKALGAHHVILRLRRR